MLRPGVQHDFDVAERDALRFVLGGMRLRKSRPRRKRGHGHDANGHDANGHDGNSMLPQCSTSFLEAVRISRAATLTTTAELPQDRIAAPRRTGVPGHNRP